MKTEEIIQEILKKPTCNHCLGRQFGQVGTGMTNDRRGKKYREIAHKTNSEISFEESKECYLCKNFFKEKIDIAAENIVKKLKGIEFETFLVGSIIPSELAKREEELWEGIGIENVEPLKSEINREVGKIIEKLTKKKFSRENQDVVILIDVEKLLPRIEIRSLFVYGLYSKLARGIPQTKWICSNCNGKGCVECKGEGKMYKTSVQEIIEKPLLKAAKSNRSSFHGSGREDIDARNLGWRPFVLEIIKPVKRKISLQKIQQQINKSKKVKVKGLKLVGKGLIRKLKTEKIDKTYSAEIEFEENIDKTKLKNLKLFEGAVILQKTPLRVVHRRSDKLRKRFVKKISWKVSGEKKFILKVTSESGLYIKELINGDDGRTQPNVAEILCNKVKKINLDVIKIHTK